jgi:hypothetical protein
MAVTGTYNILFPGPHGDPEYVLTMNEGEKGVVTGTLAGNGNSVELSKGIASGNLFTFYADHREVLGKGEGQLPPPEKMIFRCLGSVEDDKIKMAMFSDENDFMLDIEGTRA